MIVHKHFYVRCGDFDGHSCRIVCVTQQRVKKGPGKGRNVAVVCKL